MATLSDKYPFSKSGSDPKKYREKPDGKTCDWPDCCSEGEHRAPKTRDDLSSFYWFCLLHAREYNAKWNYYEGMSDHEVDADVRHDTAWQRPSWPLSGIGLHKLRDPLNILENGPNTGENAPGCPFPLESPEARALAEMDLNWPVTQDSVKACYKKLVKRHHPDANSGSKEAEERFKRIKEAYETLMPRLADFGPSV